MIRTKKQLEEWVREHGARPGDTETLAAPVAPTKQQRWKAKNKAKVNAAQAVLMRKRRAASKEEK